jgi:caa(3)-type oxidase subunit IV
MQNEETPQPPYMMIWGVLAVLMFAKVGVSLVGMPQWLSITLLVMISLVSALLVALYYMHLRSSRGSSGSWRHPDSR